MGSCLLRLARASFAMLKEDVLDPWSFIVVVGCCLGFAVCAGQWVFLLFVCCLCLYHYFFVRIVASCLRESKEKKLKLGLKKASYSHSRAVFREDSLDPW